MRVFWLWDTLNYSWDKEIFFSIESAKEYAIEHGGYCRYIIFEKIDWVTE